MQAERNNWVGKLKSKLRMNLKDSKAYTEDEIEFMLQQCMDMNTLSLLPKEIQDKYTITDCYVYIPLTQEIVDDLISNFDSTIDEIVAKEEESSKPENKNKDTEIWYKVVDNGCSFFCGSLCGYPARMCPAYREYLENLDMFKGDSSKSKSNKSKSNNSSDDSDDNDILTELGLI
jgi:hypothetical protein